MIEALARDLDWEGCFNARDLGGLHTVSGGVTRSRALVRSDSPDRLTGNGWAALTSHGVRTIVDLRSASERPADATPPAGLASIRAPLFDFEDSVFWEVWGGEREALPFYWALLHRWPERFAEAVVVVARSGNGGTLVHCQVGRDRTGLVAMLILASVGVLATEIATDYALSAARLRPLYDLRSRVVGDGDDCRDLAENTSAEATMVGLLEDLDVREYLLDNGVERDDLAVLERRLVTS